MFTITNVWQRDHSHFDKTILLGPKQIGQSSLSGTLLKLSLGPVVVNIVLLYINAGVENFSSRRARFTETICSRAIVFLKKIT